MFDGFWFPTCGSSASTPSSRRTSRCRSIYASASTASGAPTPQFRELYWFLSRECLVEGGEQSPVSRLLSKSVSQQLAIRDGFYEVYYEIRADLIAAIEVATQDREPVVTRDELLRAAQRLLDRMLFLYYCEDNPERLIPSDTIKRATDAARSLPGANDHKVYDALKALFREVDEGSPPSNVVRLAGYNGELFKYDPIIDEIDLPDALHDKRYEYKAGDIDRHVAGVWGLHEFDFWRELNEHLLGHIFEQSLVGPRNAREGRDSLARSTSRAPETRHLLHLGDPVRLPVVAGALDTTRRADASYAGQGQARSDLGAELETRQKDLSELRIADLACGSGRLPGVELPGAPRRLLAHQRGAAALASRQPDLLTLGQTLTQAQLLRDTLTGLTCSRRQSRSRSSRCGFGQRGRTRRCRTSRRTW